MSVFSLAGLLCRKRPIGHGRGRSRRYRCRPSTLQRNGLVCGELRLERRPRSIDSEAWKSSAFPASAKQLPLTVSTWMLLVNPVGSLLQLGLRLVTCVEVWIQSALTSTAGAGNAMSSPPAAVMGLAGPIPEAVARDVIRGRAVLPDFLADDQLRLALGRVPGLVAVLVGRRPATLVTTDAELGFLTQRKRAPVEQMGRCPPRPEFGTPRPLAGSGGYICACSIQFSQTTNGYCS